MRKSILLLILILTYSISNGQSETSKFKAEKLKFAGLGKPELIGQFTSTDFSALWLHTESESVFGFIGSNYQRLRMKFITVTKDKVLPNTYNVSGKSKVGDNTIGFKGTIKITNIRKFKKTALGVDDELKDKGLKGQFQIVGNYDFAEDASQKASGTFKGVFVTGFYLDSKSEFHYDDIRIYADNFTNNQFVGQWASYKNKLVKRCNWGDYRVPNSGDLDIGAGEFSPNTKYAKYGWNTAINANWWK